MASFTFTKHIPVRWIVGISGCLRQQRVQAQIGTLLFTMAMLG